MPEFVSRWWGWFQARTGVQKALIAVVALIVLALLSRVVWIVASVGFGFALVVLIYRLARRRPVRAWAIATVTLLAVAMVFGGVSTALYGPTEEQAKAPRSEKPHPEKQQPQKPPADQKGDEQQASEAEPKHEEGAPKRQEGPPEYSVVDVYIDKGDGPGSAAALQVIAPDVDRGKDAARLAAADYATHDYVMMDLYTSEAAQDDGDVYATATVAFSEQGSEWTGLDIGEMRYDRN